VERGDTGFSLTQFDEQTGAATRVQAAQSRVWLRADCDFRKDTAQFSYSLDGKEYVRIGDPFVMAYGLITFQGIRYSLFSYHRPGGEGGFADFDSIDVREPHPRGLTKAIPFGREIELNSTSPLGKFRVRDRGLGRVALEAGRGFLSVDGEGAVSYRRGRPGAAETFQWTETFTGELMLMSLATHKYLRADPATGMLAATSPGPRSSADDGVRFDWKLAGR
jgi:hypothetical protein